MSVVRRPRGWEIPESRVTPERVYVDRRRFLKQLGIGGAGTAAWLAGGLTVCAEGPSRGAGPTTQPTGLGPPTPGAAPPPGGAVVGGGAGSGTGGSGATDAGTAPADLRAKYPARRSSRFERADRPVTPEQIASRYNNFYEFTTNKSGVWEITGTLRTRPWSVEVAGLCNKPGTYDFDDLLRGMELEERVYRFRCVEAWSMVVPWTGTPLGTFLDRFEPQGSAKYVRFVTVHRPSELPGQATTPYPWPYFEGLRMDEARNDLALLVTGIYGHPMPTQHGTPLRIITPWKYGFKSIKSLVRIEFTEQQPTTFWNQLVPREYDFFANVDPSTPHPRWTQATERDIGAEGRRIPTLPYNGYADLVAGLYGG